MKKPIFIAIIISIIAILWVMSGVLSGNEKEEISNEQADIAAPAAQPDNQRVEVRVRDLSAQIMDDETEVTGRTQANRKVTLRSEAEGQIARLNFKRGDRVQKGQTLSQLQIRDQQARVSEAQQVLKQRQIQYNAAKELEKKGYNSRVRLAEKNAELEQARAQLKLAKENLAKTTLRAPFDAVVNAQMVEIGDYVNAGSEIAGLVDLDPIEITGFLTEKQIGTLSLGDKANATLLDGRMVGGNITYIAPAADEQTRTFAFELTVPNPDMAIKEGLTAKIMVPFQEDKAYKISPSVLSLSDNGAIGVKAVNAQNLVEFLPIRLLKDTPEFLWVGDLPDTVRLITVGQEFVVVGQEVTPIQGDITDTDEKKSSPSSNLGEPPAS